MAAGLHAVDVVVLVIYLLTVVAIGVLAQRWRRVQLWLRRRRRSNRESAYRSGSSDVFAPDTEAQDTESFFLGNRSLPWWALAASGIASNVDVSGTAINTAMIWSLGLNGFYVEFRGGATLSLALFLVFGKWTRRSEKMTVAEWMCFRFGHGRAGACARAIASGTMLIQTTLMVTYFCIGSGKFVSEFLDIPEMLGISPTFWASLMITSLAMVYTVASGLQGVVWTDVFQGWRVLSCGFCRSGISELTRASSPQVF
jgi:Na+/pantothenate symporter